MLPSNIQEIPDVDLDVKDREYALSVLGNPIIASQIDKRNGLVLHKTGVYFQNIPVDPITGFSSFPYDMAEDLGYFKVDIIPYHIYDHVESNDDMDSLLAVIQNGDFPWRWFQEERFFDNDDADRIVTQLGRHYELCQQYPPESVEDVAILNALIRPRKKYLVGRDWREIKELVWQKLPEEDSDDIRNYFFKKSHAVAFAMAILVHMQLIDRMDDDKIEDFYD